MRKTALAAAAAVLLLSGCKKGSADGSKAETNTLVASTPPSAPSMGFGVPELADAPKGDSRQAQLYAAVAAARKAPQTQAGAEAAAQAGKILFDGDANRQGAGNDPGVVVVPADAGNTLKVAYTRQARRNTLKISEPPPPGVDDGDAHRLLTSPGWVYPVPNNADGRVAKVSSGREMRKGHDEVWGTADDYFHRGVDIMYRRPKCGKQVLPWTSACYDMPDGTPAFAAFDGEVVFSDDVENGGLVTIKHGKGVKTAYVHLSKRLVQKGDTVKAGQPVGIIGYAPNGYRLAHLHFDVIVNERFVDPEPYLKRWERMAPEGSSAQLLAQAR